MRHVFSKVWILTCVLILAAGCSSTPAARQDTSSNEPQYVFLFIGDGMGFAQVELAERWHQQEHGTSLRINRLPVRGQAETYSANAEVTDSAAAGTALAAGVKTDNGMIGQTPDGEKVTSIAHDFLCAGGNVGILTSVQVNHATPACFYSHIDHRNRYSEIALQFDASGFDLLVGRSIHSPDDRREEIVASWEADGMAVVERIAEGHQVPLDQRLVVADASLADPDAKPGQLSEAVALAIERLNRGHGFFMMVEGGAIDWRGHDNKAWENSRELLAFDRALEVAYRFYEQHPDETLIVVTADHETGGLRLNSEVDLEALAQVPQQEENLAAALPQNDEALTREVVEQAVVEAMDLGSLTEAERTTLAEAASGSLSGRRNNVLRIARRIVQQRAGVTWTTGGHTGVNVPIRAVGVGAERFEGTMDNTEIPRRIRQIALPRAAE